MNLSELNIALIANSEHSFNQIKGLLEETHLNFKTEWFKEYDTGLAELKKGKHHAYLIDYDLGEATGVELIKEAQRTYRSRTIIMLSSVFNEEWETYSIENGAGDYLEKEGLTSNTLEKSIRYARGRNKNYQRVKEERKKYQTLFQQSIDPIILCDLNFEVYEHNDAFLDLVSKEAIDSGSIQLKHIILNHKSLEKFKQAINSKHTLKNYEIKLNSAEEVLDCLINVSPIKNDAGEARGFQLIIHDITDITKNARLNREQDRISYTGKLAKLIAHEVRNPLTNINLAVGQLREIENPEPEERDIYFDIVERNSTRINDLISQLLDSSKPSELKKEEYSLEKVIAQAINLCSDRINLQNVQLYLDVAKEEKKFFLDHEKMEIALLNIMTNALEAMVNIKVPQLAVNLNHTAKNAIISIQDNGKGMTEEQCQRIFEPFYTGREGGKGLGMTLSKNIINSHSGEIKIISKVGKGTTFIITIPTA